MAIVSMDKIHIVGLANDKEAIMDSLMKLGAVELSEVTDRSDGSMESEEPQESTELSANVKYASDLMLRMKNAVELSDKYHHEKKPMFSSMRKVSSDNFMTVVSSIDDVEAKADELQNHTSEITVLNTRIMKNILIAEQLKPWTDVEIKLGDSGTEFVDMVPGTFESIDEVELFRDALRSSASESDVIVLHDNDLSFIRAIVIYHRDLAESIIPIIKGSVFRPLSISSRSGYSGDIYDECVAEIENDRNKIRELTSRCREIAENVQEFEIIYDHASVLFDKSTSQSMILDTDYTFILQGWIPSHLTDSVEKALRSEFIIAFQSRKAKTEDEYPILLKNHPLVKPYEVVTDMFSPPSVRDIDPNPIMAPFFLLFFSMMLSDAGYGLILAAGCALLIWKLKVTGSMRSMAMFIFQGSLAAIVWGFLFGGFFGDMITALSSGRFSFPTIWFNPIEDPTRLMIWSVLFGVLHLFAGMLTKAYILIITGKWKDAVFDVFSWIIALTGVGLLLGGPALSLPVLADIGKYMVITGFGVIVLFGGRDSENPVLRILKGIIGLYDITSYVSDALSYTRILALSLATAVIGMVVNKLGSILGFGFTGIILFIVVGLVGHMLNLAISTLGCYVHTSRLQYVEFFSKFYEGGGRAWDPLSVKMKYIKISNN